ncbi:MAG: polyphosphate kinase 2 family protein [Planctomycetota bacterium]|jgi:PPK2 family polyphosphate:nucleotide phosphotransferase|nr:polyphosphate kinase 2 family protein [Planctomycetota bacterium]
MKDREKILGSLRLTGSTRNRIDLSKYKTDMTKGVAGKDVAREKLAEEVRKIDILQRKLYAEAKNGLLVVFQAMDTGGKDGVIRKVFGPLNPQGVTVASFKRPNPKELSHDYLWRIHPLVPARGMIRVFNRSHYEDVLVHQVHALLPESVLKERYRQINDFERYLGENGIAVIKFFLHISKEEQKSRLESRLKDPNKRWKFEPGDLAERKFWDKYQEAYSQVMGKCATPAAPWYVIPADNKWYRDLLVAEIIKARLEEFKPSYPAEQPGLDQLTVD